MTPTTPKLGLNLALLLALATLWGASYTFIKIGGQLQEGLPAWPIFETLVGAVALIGAVYYVVAQRGKVDVVHIEADAATGEAMIG